MEKRLVIVVLALVAAVLVAVAAVEFAIPLLGPPPTPAVIPSSLPLPTGTTFNLTPRQLGNGTILFTRSFSTNLTGACQFVQGSWEATTLTTTAEGSGLNGSFSLFAFPLGSLYNGSVSFSAWAPDVVRVTRTIAATQPSPCGAPVNLGSWGVYNSGNMCPNVPPYPPYELDYTFQLRNAGNASVMTAVDFYLGYHGTTGWQLQLAGSRAYDVAAGSTANLTAVFIYYDCPGGVGGSASLAITNEWPAAP